MKLQDYKFGFFERLLLKIELQSADKNTERLLILLPVLLYMRKDDLESLLKVLPQILKSYLQPHLIQRVFSRVVIKLQEYSKNNKLFIQERQKAFECLSQNIQLYTLATDLFGTEHQQTLRLIEQIVRKRFDKDYQLDSTNLRLLAYQEKYCTPS